MVGKKGRVLIINLTRMGDLLQMTPFLSAFRQECPDVEITLMVLKQFEEVCSGFPFVDRVETFDAKDFLSRLGNPEYSLVDNYRVSEGMLAGLKRWRFDRVINLSFSNHSALITRLCLATDVVGITIDKTGNRLLKHPWVKQFYNMVGNRETNPFNYVDFVRKIGGSRGRGTMSFHVSESARDFAEVLVQGHDISESDWVVGIQPGASTENKRWPATYFGALAEELIRSGAKIVLFGNSGEKELGQRVKDAISLSREDSERHLIDAIGKTSVAQLAALLQTCDLLVTNDTGTMHIATAVGTQAVEISLGPVYFHETGPYGEGHIVIQTDMSCAPCGFHVQCKNAVCRESIGVDQVLKVVEMVRANDLEKDHQLRNTSGWDGIQVYRSTFDEDGMLEFCPVIRRPLRPIDLIKLLYREVWKIVLDEKPGEIDSNRVIERIDRFFSVSATPMDLDEDVGAFRVIAELACQGIEMSERLVEWSEKIPQNIPAIKTGGQVIHEIDEQIEQKGLTHRTCHPLTFLFRQGKENLEGEDVGVLSQETLRLYQTLFHEATLMNRGLKETVDRLGTTSGGRVICDSFSKKQISQSLKGEEKRPVVPVP
jgi:ADP-heptose:LPS heptosyltransferase